MTDRWEQIATLRRRRPRNRFVRWSVGLLALLIGVSWVAGDFRLGGWLDERRVANLQRFLFELQPWPLRDPAGGGPGVDAWVRARWVGGGGDALVDTLAISVAAIVLAGLGAALWSLPAARNFACPRPFLQGGRPASSVSLFLWHLVVLAARGSLVFMRALPEYVWAFLFLALLGPTVWPMVLALALHNTGILGKLTAEVIENADNDTPGALRALGATRFQIVLGGIIPMALPRFLLYFFYRWETCVREATVLGMLGMASLGFWIMEGRASNRYDDMLFYILLGGALVLMGDAVSAITRWVVRRA